MKFPLAHRIDRSHPYTRSEATDIRKTFAKARKALTVTPAPTPAPTTPPAVEAPANVRTLRKVKP
jgi:hypothetical protein